MKCYTQRRRDLFMLVIALFAGGFFSSLGAEVKTITPADDLAANVAAMHPGDVLILRGGSYPGIASNNMIIPSGTSWADAPVIKAYPGETVTLNSPNGFGAPSNQGQQEIKYVILDGFRINGTTNSDDATGFWGNVHHIRMINCDVYGARDDHSGIGMQPNQSNIVPRFIEIINTRVHNNGSGSGSGSTGHGIYGATMDSLFDGLVVYANGDHGIQIYSEFVTPSRNVIQRSYFYGNGTGAGVSGAGIVIYGDSNSAINNIVSGGRDYGIHTKGNNHKVYFNTIYSTPGLGIFVESGNTPVRNNISYSSDGISGGSQSNNLTSDPKFVNASAGDFHLQSGSPAIGAGVAISGINTDFEGKPRPNPPSIGAYEAGSGGGGGGTPEPLPAPTSLTVAQNGGSPQNGGGNGSSEPSYSYNEPATSWQQSSTSQPSGPVTSDISVPFLVAGVLVAALIFSD